MSVPKWEFKLVHLLTWMNPRCDGWNGDRSWKDWGIMSIKEIDTLLLRAWASETKKPLKEPQSLMALLFVSSNLQMYLDETTWGKHWEKEKLKFILPLWIFWNLRIRVIMTTNKPKGIQHTKIKGELVPYSHRCRQSKSTGNCMCTVNQVGQI